MASGAGIMCELRTWEAARPGVLGERDLKEPLLFMLIVPPASPPTPSPPPLAGPLQLLPLEPPMIKVPSQEAFRKIQQSLYNYDPA